MTTGEKPLVWALHGVRTGDNDQVRALTDALDWPTLHKPLAYNALHHLPHWLVGSSRATLRPSARTALRPPWPDLVIAAGQRSVAPACWIRAQAGGHTRLVHIGRPRARLDLFDLVLTTPQYGLPEGRNVEVLPLPLAAAHEAGGSAEDELERCGADLAALPRPWIGVLVGGPVWPYRMDGNAVRRLAADLDRYHALHGGSVLLSTSPRSAAGSGEDISAAMRAPRFVHSWERDAPDPYQAILAECDQLVVTGDSVSMIADACRTGRPLGIWLPPQRRDPLSRSFLALGTQATTLGLSGRTLRWLARRGLATPPRSVERLHRTLVESGRAILFDGSRTPPLSAHSGPAYEGLEYAAERVRALLTDAGRATQHATVDSQLDSN